MPTVGTGKKKREFAYTPKGRRDAAAEEVKRRELKRKKQKPEKVRKKDRILRGYVGKFPRKGR